MGLSGALDLGSRGPNRQTSNIRQGQGFQHAQQGMARVLSESLFAIVRESGISLTLTTVLDLLPGERTDEKQISSSYSNTAPTALEKSQSGRRFNFGLLGAGGGWHPNQTVD